mgnify:CR=1 FL=1
MFRFDLTVNRADLQEALKNANVMAFLRAIRLGEGTTDEAGYYRLVGGGTFTDDRWHPNVRVFVKRYNVHSSAAGAYQIINRTWQGLKRIYGFPDFSPACQDEAAVALIWGRRALNDVIDGRFDVAIRKCALEWASLPGSAAGQRIESLESLRQAYTDAGGTFAIA